jgi:tRNA(fMet)-specific endonuclease VapC
LNALPPEEVATTIVSYEEQTRGWLAFLAKARTLDAQIAAYEKLHSHLRTYCRIAVLDFDKTAAREYQLLRNARIRIGTLDMRIAAIALSHGATVLTRNAVDFSLVPGLVVEDWTA